MENPVLLALARRKTDVSNFRQAKQASLARGIVRHKGTYEIRKGNSQPMNVRVPYIQDLRLASSVPYRYSDYGMTWDYPGKHAAFATFRAQPRR